MTNNFVVFVRINSQKSSSSELLYEKVFYRCSKRLCRQSQGRCIRRSYYKLNTFLVTDGMGIGRPVIYAFVESEHFAPLRRLFVCASCLFNEMMGGEHPAKAFDMDKLTSQVGAAKAPFGCDIILCYFHALQAIQKHVRFIALLYLLQTISNRSRHIFHRMARFDNAAEFRYDVQILRRTDPGFVSYLTAHWLYITRKCAIYAQPGLVHFGNVTNNRLENAKGLLKRRLHHADSLEHAIQKVSQHSEWLMREYEMHTTYYCDRRKIRERDRYVLPVVSQMTTYAANQVLRHIGTCTSNLIYHQTVQFKVRNPLLVTVSLWYKPRNVLRWLTSRLEPARAPFTNQCGYPAYAYSRYSEATRSPAAMSLVASVANQLTLLTAGVREIDYYTTAIVAVKSLAHCVEKIFRCAHQVSAHRSIELFPLVAQKSHKRSLPSIKRSAKIECYDMDLDRSMEAQPSVATSPSLINDNGNQETQDFFSRKEGNTNLFRTTMSGSRKHGVAQTNQVP
ncbi:hypothetical protein CLF_105670 [Clonorchis sinensis]|uniref:MULE transposase domain-containing protein n=1 Tax=Clonorchis sinensis TaxID=79923 RepID=G7YDY4_CLOSI|nr:hypothetical protein CLF_105670 [Clonorchis sinensis]